MRPFAVRRRILRRFHQVLDELRIDTAVEDSRRVEGTAMTLSPADVELLAHTIRIFGTNSFVDDQRL
jgi:hypothetical protein